MSNKGMSPDNCSQDSQDPLCLTTQALTSASQVQAPAVAISAGSWIAFAIAIIFLFQLLRPNNKHVYAPKLKHAVSDDKVPPKLDDGFFSWLPPMFRYHEKELLPIIGLDAVTFLRFLRMCRYLTTALGIGMAVVLIPINIAYNAKNPSTSRDPISFLTRISMSRVSGSYLWAHVAMSYLGTLLALAFIYYNYKRMLTLRHAFFRSPEYQTQFHSRTLMITGVKKPLQSDEALAGVLSSIGMPYPTTSVHIGRVVGALPDLIEKHNDLVRKLEHVFAKYLKNPNELPAKRPTVTIGGTAGCGGKSVDAIDYYTDQINKCEAAIENMRERIAEKRPESYGFASLAAVSYAHAAARSLQGKKPRGLVIDLAPAPKDIIWKNLNLTASERFRSSTIGFLFLSLLLFFNAVPLLAVSLITNMASFRFLPAFDWLNNWYQSSQWTFAAVAALIPPTITGIMGYFLPVGMRRIAKYRGVLTKSRLDRVIIAQYFGFLVISQFLIFTLIGILISLVSYIVSAATQNHQNYKDILKYVQRHLPAQIKQQYFLTSNYWLTWIPLRGFLAIFDLAQIIKLMLVWVQKGFFGRTPRDVREYTKPPNFDYAVYYANLLFMFAVAMLYAPLVPLVVIFSAIAFWISSVVYKYQLMYVFTTKNESGGGLWRVVINRMLVCIVFMQLILTLCIALDQGYIKSVATLPPILFVLAFKLYCRKTFDRHFTWYIPSSVELAKEVVHTGDSRHHRLQRRFGHPALHERLFTPMVHANIKHMLPRVYSGRIEEMTKLDGETMATTNVTGGLKIAAVEESQLEWNRDRDDDTRSIMSGTTLGNFAYGGRSTPLGDSPSGTPNTFVGVGANGGANDYFKSQYAAYLASGPGSVHKAGSVAGNTMDDFEMGHYPKGSRDNLLDHADSAVMGHPAQHGRTASGNTYANFYAPSMAPSVPSVEQGPVGNAYGYPLQHAYSRTGDPGLAGYVPTSQGGGPQRYGHAAQGSTGSLPFTTTAIGAQGSAPGSGLRGATAPVHHAQQASYGSAPVGVAPMGTPQQLPQRHQRQGTAGSMGAAMMYTNSPTSMSPSAPTVPVSPAAQVQAQYQQSSPYYAQQNQHYQQQQQQQQYYQQQGPPPQSQSRPPPPQQQQQQYPGPGYGQQGGYRGPPGAGGGGGSGYQPMR
ncbi:hypothetical protein OC845_003425 [Tilletia horrida]|nr:hypothetical protein OC845_003425 [Tilletia horrida]